jgi:hypothetical protein
MMAEQHIDILAHHALLLAIPAFAPAIAIVGVVMWVAMRDRRIPDDANTVEGLEGVDRNDKREDQR